jgi:hypothetical protein
LTFLATAPNRSGWAIADGEREEKFVNSFTSTFVGCAVLMGTPIVELENKKIPMKSTGNIRKGLLKFQATRIINVMRT